VAKTLNCLIGTYKEFGEISLIEEVKKTVKHLNPQPEPPGEGASKSKTAKKSEPKYPPKR
jgi:hypothetical protein